MYPLARNQYINNSPGVFSCIRAGANTGAACIRTIPLRIWQNTQETPTQKYFPVFALVRIQAPHVFAQKVIPQDFCPACIGFVPGGNLFEKHFNFSLDRSRTSICSHWRHPKGYQTVRCSKLNKMPFWYPSILIPLWVLLKRHPNGYQNRRVPKCLVLNLKNLPFWYPIRFDTPLGFDD